MSAILRLTEEAIVLQNGRVALRDQSDRAVDFYMTSGMSEVGEHRWDGDLPTVAGADPFLPLALRVLNPAGRPSDRVLASESFAIEIEYELKESVKGLRVGLYLFTSRGEPVFTSFDTDDPEAYAEHEVRPAGRYRSRCKIPGLLLNEGRFVLGVNASAFKVRSYFTDEHALSFSVDGTGAPGSQWAERRHGPLRPQLEWSIMDAVT
jgi:lipopolysaccharide transport system ATP-binding protein